MPNLMLSRLAKDMCHFRLEYFRFSLLLGTGAISTEPVISPKSSDRLRMLVFFVSQRTSVKISVIRRFSLLMHLTGATRCTAADARFFMSLQTSSMASVHQFTKTFN